MSLKPYRKSRKHHHRARLETSQWEKPWKGWDWNWAKKKGFELFSKKGFVLVLLLFAISIGTAAMYSDPNNWLFHSHTSASSVTGPDPSTYLWRASSPNNDTSEFNVVNVAYTTGTRDSITNKVLSMNPTATQSAVALTKGTIDFSTVSGKELWSLFDWDAVNGPGTCCGSFQPWGMYLTTNGTAPQGAQYNPETDSSVALIMRVISTGGGAAGQFNMNLFLQRKQVETISSEMGSGGCSQATSCFLNMSFFRDPTAHWVEPNYLLNFTSRTNAGSCVGITGGGCSSMQELSSSNLVSTQLLPWFAFQGTPYYVGFYQLFNEPMHIQWTFDSGSVPTACNPSCSQFILYIPVPTAAVSPPNIDTGGFFGPVIRALISIGVFILNAILGFIAFITPALQAALSFMESILVTTLNIIGNALLLGNVGTSLQSLINVVITFFTSGNFASIFTNLPASISRLIDILSIYFPWLPNALAVAANVAAFAINGINFVLTVFTFATKIGIGILATILIVLYFVYTGDNALGGFLEFAQTTVWLIVGLGLKFLINLTNFSLDVVTSIIGIIPKPLIQMSTHALPRIPVVDVDATFVPPSGLMGEIRNGNLFALALWISGLLFTDLYESASPALPGSIGSITPSAASALVPLTGLVPLLEIMTMFVWVAAVFVVPIGWFSNAMDLGSLPFESGLGTRPVTHFGVKIGKAEKHTGDIRGAVRGFRSAFRRGRAKPKGPTPEEQATA